MKKLNQVLGRRSSSLSLTRQKTFEEWVRYLSIVNNKEENKNILFNYFFDRFASSPQLFYQFLEYFQDLISKNPSENLAEKYLQILSPLCERFNFNEEKNLLNDICFKIVDPQQYSKIKDFLTKYDKEAQEIINRVLRKFEDLLIKENYIFELIGRYKNIYSIHTKMKLKSRELPKLNDIFAFRIILEATDTDMCFEVANLLHDTFTPLPDLFKDYITIPKINGYQSLHTGLANVLENLDIPIEVQIRTRDMHVFAKNGLAAHWLYDQDKKAKVITEKERRLLDYLSCMARSSEEERQIHCFSYKGDIVNLNQNSTILDFAYKIHTEVGNSAISAKVNNEEKPLFYKIKEGEQIEIIQSKNIEVSPKWLTYTKNKQTQKKITDMLRIYEKPHKKAVTR
jgi:GTP diphosphokinase / guanosine-3',5'-bis(diphosphate) 3'-diphosphatase